ncbi:type II toxin-antitoxin system CcdA family antitoxin [Flavisphingopyxis soli]|nr:type II toxin-antitoxin system CcdA family antitoxin [Sphingorhabdus soli]
MNHSPRMSRVSGAMKRATNVSLNAELIVQAKELGINISQACEAGLEQSIRATTAEAWLAANRDALESSNDFVAQNGLPLARHRQF